jgi:AcrR family transcriptional regulator
MATTPPRAERRTDALSRDRIVAAAVELLDAGGEAALTFRALATRLATGSGAIYWHVANKDELLAATTDHVIAGVVDLRPAAGAPAPDPRAAIRAIGLGLFDAIDAHPWVGTQLTREPWQRAMVQVIEGIGRQVWALGVPERAQFDVAMAIGSYILGVAGQNAANARRVTSPAGRTAYLEMVAARWAELDPAEYPFVRQVAAVMPAHDDREQFLAGLDIFLAGVAARH